MRTFLLIKIIKYYKPPRHAMRATPPLKGGEYSFSKHHYSLLILQLPSNQGGVP